MMEKNTDRTRLAMRVSGWTLAGNALLSLGKLAAGVWGGSGALVSDAVHSASDAATTVIVMIGLRFSGREADREHPYGHERFECVCSAFLAALLMLTGLAIGMQAARQLLSGEITGVPALPALAAALISVAAKEVMYRVTIRTARKINSPALKADAWHHRSDALSSVGSFAGILGARLGLTWMDAAASLVICGFILKAGADVLREALRGMTDRACDAETADGIRSVAAQTPGVRGVDLLNTRMFGSRIYVDAEIRADAQLTLAQAHQIAENVHAAVEKAFPDVKHCMVHVNPDAENRETKG